MYIVFLSRLLLLFLGLFESAAAATPTNFCYDDLDGRNPPYCVGEPQPCSKLDDIDCHSAEGCAMEGGFLGMFGECTGTPLPCSHFHGSPIDCEIQKGCTNYVDPPCALDPFDIAITPFATATPYSLDELFCDADFVEPGKAVGGCGKIRTSRDGEVTLYMVGETGGYTGCEMTVGGGDCQICEICGSGLAASFNCANALTLRTIEGDDRCPNGTRCVGQDCTGNCICQSIDGVSTTPEEEPTTPELLDAYIYTRYLQTGQNALPQTNESVAREYCDDCEHQSTNSSCVPLHNVRIQHQCLEWSSGGGIAYDTNLTHMCADRYPDNVCTPNTARKCAGGLLLNTCDESSGFTTQELKDWCIVGKGGGEQQGIGNYITIPVIKTQVYDTLEKCTAGVGANEIPMAVDKDNCLPFATSVNGTIVSGSLRTYCDPNSTFLISDFYSDPNCREQSSDLDIVQRVLSGDQCTETLNFALAAKGYMTASCGSLKDPSQEVIYCKSFYQAGFGSSINLTATESPIPSSAPSPSVAPESFFKHQRQWRGKRKNHKDKRTNHTHRVVPQIVLISGFWWCLWLLV